MKTYPTLPLAQLPLWQEVPAAVETLYRDALAAFDRKVIALDDDPTGIQTVHGVNVYTDWTQERLLDCFRDGDAISFILTNSRSFTAAQTETVHQEIARRVCRAAAETGRDYVLISRGDSTMRGHWPLETQTLADACIVMTACQFPEVERVEISSEGFWTSRPASRILSPAELELDTLLP